MLELPDDATVAARLPAAATVINLVLTLRSVALNGIALTDDDVANHAQYLAGVLDILRPASPRFLGDFLFDRAPTRAPMLERPGRTARAEPDTHSQIGER